MYSNTEEVNECVLRARPGREETKMDGEMMEGGQRIIGDRRESDASMSCASARPKKLRDRLQVGDRSQRNSLVHPRLRSLLPASQGL
jgi:hypothetical protein